MGCCCSTPEDPRMAQYRAAKAYLTKANIVLAVAGSREKLRLIPEAITLYGTYIRCMAVHVFKEFDRSSATVTKGKATGADRAKREPLINMALGCRRIMHHRAGLQQRAVREAQNDCCGGTYIPTDPAAPAMLAPWEWTEWLIMCKGNTDIEKHLEKMGLLKVESKIMQAERLAAAAAPTTNVSLALNNTNTNNVNPNISVAGPTTNIAGPSTNIQANPNNSNSNAQTGQGNVAPAVGAGPGAGTAAGGTANPMMGMGGMGGMGGYMQPMGSGMMGHMGSGGSSGDYAAMMQQQMMQQQMMAQQMMQHQLMQQQMAQAQGGQGQAGMQGMYYPQSPMSPMGSSHSPMGNTGQQQPQFNAYMMPNNGSGGYGQQQPGYGHPGGAYGQPNMGQMPSSSMPMPHGQQASAPPAGYPAPAEGVPVGKVNV